MIPILIVFIPFPERIFVTIQRRFIKMAKSPFCSFPIFFREFLGFLLNWQKLGLKASNRLPVLTQNAFEALIRKKVNVTSQKGFFATTTRPH
jgi:hypothetical protein